jgi:hypothetical protein
MQPPDALIWAGINHLPTVGDGRQSGTVESPSILNASPEAAVGGGLALLRTGDRVRLDLNAGPARRAGARGRVGGAPRGLDAARAPQPDALAGDLPHPCRPARRRRLPRTAPRPTAGSGRTCRATITEILDWGALLMLDRGLLPVEAGGLGFMLFSAAMAAGRLAGDRIVARLGGRNTLSRAGSSRRGARAHPDRRRRGRAGRLHARGLRLRQPRSRPASARQAVRRTWRPASPSRRSRRSATPGSFSAPPPSASCPRRRACRPPSGASPFWSSRFPPAPGPRRADGRSASRAAVRTAGATARASPEARSTGQREAKSPRPGCSG